MSKEKFFKVFSNLPEPERYQVIAIIENRPYSWNVVYNEISNDTELGRKILTKMEIMGIL